MWWNFLLNNRVTRFIGAALAGVAAILAYGAINRRKGTREAEQRAKEAAQNDTIKRHEKINDAENDRPADAAAAADRLRRWLDTPPD